MRRMIEQTDAGEIRTLILTRSPVNALNRELLMQLNQALLDSEREGVRGVILTGSGGCFSAGLDISELLALDTAGLTEFLTEFMHCLLRLSLAPMPIVAAVNGHAPAGGAVLSLYCDRRIMVSGRARMGLNEVAVGLYPGPLILRLLERTVGVRLAAELLMTGALLEPEAARHVGLVDELATPTQLLATATSWLHRVLALPPAAFAATRALVRQDLVLATRGALDADVAALVAEWESTATRECLLRLLESTGTRPALH